MLNRKGSITIEAIFYVIIMLILCIMLSSIILRNISYKNNSKIKIYQGLSILKKSLMPYQKLTRFNNKELEVVGKIKFKIVNDQLYETPGYMPYLQGIENAKFKYRKSKVYLEFYHNKVKYNSLIFYDK